MSTTLSSSGRELFDQLTARTFFVVDTEFSTHDDQHHLISIALIPVIGGRRARATTELYRVMNPGVPIDSYSSTVHGFTDPDVARRPGFARFATAIVERLTEDGAVFVCHSTIDAHVLRRELERLDERAAEGESGITVGLADLPDLPVLDTQRLAHVVRYPGVKRPQIKLDRLCDLTGVARTATAHNARHDARATANALIELLRHAAETASHDTFAALLCEAASGTTLTPTGPAFIRLNRRQRTKLSAEHIALHTEPLAEPVAAHSARAEAWLDMAAECAALRCPYLREEAQVAAPHNGATLLRPLMDDLPHLNEPGQAGTLLGAVEELLRTPPAEGAEATLTAARALKWWVTARPLIAATTGCGAAGTDVACPACYDGAPCSRDTVGTALADIVTLGTQTKMTDARARALTSRVAKGPLNTWRRHHPEVLAYALWRVARYWFGQGHDERAYDAVDHGIAMGVHTTDPRLAELACERLVEAGHTETAFTAARTVLSRRTSDPAYEDLADWMLFAQNALYAQQPVPRAPITHPRLARPDGHAHPRLYS